MAQTPGQIEASARARAQGTAQGRALLSPLQKRSEYLAEALEALRASGQQISGYGELGTKLLAQALLERTANRTDEALSAEASNAALARRQRLAAAIGGTVEGEPVEVGTGRLGNPFSRIGDMIRGGPPSSIPEPGRGVPIVPQMPQPQMQGAPLPPAQPQGRPQAMADAGDEMFLRDSAPGLLPVGRGAQMASGPIAPPPPPPPPAGGPVPVGQPPQQPMPQQPAPQQMAQAGGGMPSPFMPTPDEQQLIMGMLDSGDPEAVARAEAIIQAIQNRQINPDVRVEGGVAYNANDPRALSRTFPNMTEVRGTILDLNDPRNRGQHIPNVAEGITLVPDEQGRRIAQEVPGYTGIMAGREGAITGARGEAEAQTDLVEVQDERGRSVWISRAQALQQPIAGQDPQIANLRENLPFAQQQVARVVQTTGVLGREVGRALSIIESNPGVTGLIASGARLIPGTPAYDLSEALKTVAGNVGFNSLQELRAASATGGGVGALTERELNILSSLLGSLSQLQSEPALVGSLRQVNDLSTQAAQRAEEAFRTTYAPVLPGAAQGQPRRRTYNPQTGGFD